MSESSKMTRFGMGWLKSLEVEGNPVLAKVVSDLKGPKNNRKRISIGKKELLIIKDHMDPEDNRLKSFIGNVLKAKQRQAFPSVTHFEYYVIISDRYKNFQKNCDELLTIYEDLGKNNSIIAALVHIYLKEKLYDKRRKFLAQNRVDIEGELETKQQYLQSQFQRSRIETAKDWEKVTEIYEWLLEEPASALKSLKSAILAYTSELDARIESSKSKSHEDPFQQMTDVQMREHMTETHWVISRINLLTTSFKEKAPERAEELPGSIVIPDTMKAAMDEIESNVSLGM